MSMLIACDAYYVEGLNAFAKIVAIEISKEKAALVDIQPEMAELTQEGKTAEAEELRNRRNAVYRGCNRSK